MLTPHGARRPVDSRRGWPRSRAGRRRLSSLRTEQPSELSRAAQVLGPMNVGHGRRTRRARPQGGRPIQSRRCEAPLRAARQGARLVCCPPTRWRRSRRSPRRPRSSSRPSGGVAVQWDAALATLPADWSDLLCELEIASSDFLPRAALLARRSTRRATATGSASCSAARDARATASPPRWHVAASSASTRRRSRHVSRSCASSGHPQRRHARPRLARRRPGPVGAGVRPVGSTWVRGRATTLPRMVVLCGSHWKIERPLLEHDLPGLRPDVATDVFLFTPAPRTCALWIDERSRATIV